MNVLKKHWPLIVALGVLWLTIAILLTLSIRLTQGRLIYTLDDPYIHMSIAKNFAQHGVWGVNKHEFASASSSPLFTFLLSLNYSLFGVNEVSPFILNVIFATLTVFGAYFLLRKYALRDVFTIIVLLSIIFLTPLAPIVFTGQEHTMHIFLVIPFVYLSAKILSSERATFMEYISLFILAALMTPTRYEGIFLILVICVLFILRRRLLPSLCLGVAGILPIAIYGMISMSYGWYFLPNPILIKGNVPEFSLTGVGKFLYHFGSQIVRNPHILALILGALYLVLRSDKPKAPWKDSTILLTIFLATTLLHLLLAGTRWFYRYEAYLVALGISVIAIRISEYLPEKLSIKFDKSFILKHRVAALLILFAISPLAARGGLALRKTPLATKNIYEQQYQMGLFVREFYQGQAIAANDIGAINYLADIECLDLWGLANLEIAKLKREKNYRTQQIYEMTKQKEVKIAIVYDHWFASDEIGGLPSQWVKAGQWKILNNVVCGGDVVSFYAVDQSEIDPLIENFKAFLSRLPKDVIVLPGDYGK
jgi:hypothetical protein